MWYARFVHPVFRLTRRGPAPGAVDRVLLIGTLVVVVGTLIVSLLLLAGGTRRMLAAPSGQRPASDAPAAVVVPATPVPTTSDPVTLGAVMPLAPQAVTPAAPEPESGPMICLDPGHGGSDPGAVRPADGLAEADLTLAYAESLSTRLTAEGFSVVLTRRDADAVNAAGADVNGDGVAGDELDELQARIDICNAYSADLLVSIHFNGHNDPAKAGYEAWYTAERPFGAESARFAELAHEELGRWLAAAGHETVARGANPDRDLLRPDEADTFAHLVLTGPAVPGKVRASRMPGAIVEALYLTNDADAATLVSPAGWDAIVTAYQQAIHRYFAEAPA